MRLWTVDCAGSIYSRRSIIRSETFLCSKCYNIWSPLKSTFLGFLHVPCKVSFYASAYRAQKSNQNLNLKDSIDRAWHAAIDMETGERSWALSATLIWNRKKWQASESDAWRPILDLVPNFPLQEFLETREKVWLPARVDWYIIWSCLSYRTLQSSNVARLPCEAKPTKALA